MADSPPSTSTSTVFPTHQHGCTGPTCNPGHTHEVDWDACTPECQAALDSSPTAIPTHFCPLARKRKIFGKKTSAAPKGNFVLAFLAVTNCATQVTTRLTMNRSTPKTRNTRNWDQWLGSGRSSSTNVPSTMWKWPKTGGTHWTSSSYSYVAQFQFSLDD